MNLALVLCLIATVVPVFFRKIGTTPTWLSLQALALGWITLGQHHELDIHALVAGLEVLVLRAWLVPTVLRNTLRDHPHADHDVMPSNLFAWGVAIALIILALKFGANARTDTRALTLGVVAATAMMAFLVLSTNDAPAAQLIALLFMENALALFESLMPEHWPLPVHAAITGVYVLTVGIGSWLVRTQTITPDLPSTPLENG
jgi:hydrogenase-4 membrane subunit HyfE